MVNDPKYIGQSDTVYQSLDELCGLLLGLTVLTPFLWGPMMWLLRESYSRIAKQTHAAVFAAGWAVLIIDPWRRLAWFID
jgi:hypothetical protein